MNIMIELPKKNWQIIWCDSWFRIERKSASLGWCLGAPYARQLWTGLGWEGEWGCQRDLDPSPPHNLDLCLFNTQKWITFCPIYSNLLSVCVKVQFSVEKRTDRFRTDLRTDKHLNEITLISTLLLRTVSKDSKNHWKKISLHWI